MGEDVGRVAQEPRAVRTTQCVATNSFSVARSTSGSVRPISFDRPAGGDGGASAGGASPLISSTDVSADVSTDAVGAAAGAAAGAARTVSSFLTAAPFSARASASTWSFHTRPYTRRTISCWTRMLRRRINSRWMLSRFSSSLRSCSKQKFSYSRQKVRM